MTGEGAVAAMLWGGMLGLGGYWASGHLFRQPRGLSRAIGAAVLAWAWATIGALALGLSGHLARGPLLGWAAAGVALAGLARLRMSDPPDRPPPPGGPVDGAATLAIALAIWTLAWIGMPSWLLPERSISDAPIYHLYFAAQWWKSGRLWIVPAPFGDTAVLVLPGRGEVLFAASMAIAGGDILARACPFLFLILAGTSVFAIARRLGAGTSAALVATAMFATTIPNVHVLVHGERGRDLRRGLPGGGPLLPRIRPAAGVRGDAGAGRAGGGRLLEHQADRDGLRAAAAGRGGDRGDRSRGPAAGPARAPALAGHRAGLMAGYWFARNAAMTGNPLYPLQVSVLGRVWLPGWFESSAMRHSLFYLPPGDLRILADAVLDVLDPRLTPLWLAGLLAAWASWRGRPEGRWIGVVATMAVMNVGLYWLIPYRTQQRFLLPAFGLATAPLAGLLDRSRWLRWAAALLLAVHLLTPSAWPFVPIGRLTKWGLSGRLISAEQGPVPVIPTPEQWRSVAGQPDREWRVGVPALTGILALLAAPAWVLTCRRPSPALGLGAALATSALFAIPSA